MAISLNWLIIFIAIGLLSTLWVSVNPIAAIIGSIFLLAFAHRTKKRKSTYDKHTKRRAGEVYDLKQQEKRGDKNKKYKKKPNPNKRED